MSGPPKLFNLKHNLLAEMTNFQNLMKSDPEKGKEILLVGEAVIQNATQGQLRKFIAASTDLSRNPDGPLFYFLTKGLIEALKKGHLMVASFVLDNGFNLHDLNLPHILNTVIKDDSVNDNVALIAVQFLQRYQFDFNLQEKETYWAPLHYAVQRSLSRTIENLIAFGADVNAVADKDIMPLNIALQVAANPPKSKKYELAVIDESASDDKTNPTSTSTASKTSATTKESLDDELPEVILANSIVELLQKHGAKETWRRGISVVVLPQNESYSAIGAPRESSSIAASSASSSATKEFSSHNGSVNNSSNMGNSAPKKNMVRFSGASLLAAAGTVVAIPGADSSLRPSSSSTDSFMFSTSSSSSLSTSSAAAVESNVAASSDPQGDSKNSSSAAHPPKPPMEEDVHHAAKSKKGETSVGVERSTEEDNSNDPEINQITDEVSTVFLGESDDGKAFLFSTGG